jgi:hypothetical protein
MIYWHTAPSSVVDGCRQGGLFAEVCGGDTRHFATQHSMRRLEFHAHDLQEGDVVYVGVDALGRVVFVGEWCTLNDWWAELGL